MDIQQRVRVGQTIVEQSIRVFTIEDLPTALDMLLNHFKGQNILHAVRAALIGHVLQQYGKEEAARQLGMPPRTFYRHKALLKKGEEDEK